MENFIQNYFYRNSKNQLSVPIPIFIDLPLETNKKIIWQTIYDEIGNDVSFRYQPEFLQIKVVDNQTKKEYIVEGVEIFYKAGEVQIEASKKKIFTIDNKKYFIYKDKKFLLDNKTKGYKVYKPYYIYDFLDKKGLSIDNVSFYYVSVADHVEKNLQYLPSFGEFYESWPLMTQEKYNQLSDYIRIKTIPNLYNQTINKKEFSDIERFKDDFKIQLKDYFEKKPNYLITTDVISSSFVVATEDEENHYIDLEKVFKKFTTSPQIPFIVLKMYGSTRIKIDASMTDSELIKEWSLSSKTKNIKKTSIKDINADDDDIQFSEHKGLLFKLKNGPNYVNVNLFSTGRMTVRCHRSRQQDNQLITTCPSSVIKIAEYINERIPEAFKNQPGKIIINKGEDTGLSMNVDLSYNALFTQDDFQELVFNEFASNYILSDLFNREYKNDKNVITLIAKTVKKKKNKTDEYSGEPYFNLDTHNDYKFTIRRHSGYTDSTLVEILGISSFNQVELVKKWFNCILFLSQKQVKAQKNINKKYSRSDKLQSVFPTYNPRDCQKEKQPLVDEGEPFLDSYALEYKGHRFVCDNEEYRFPGFTTNGNVCCFKVDQRKKQKYISVINSDTNYVVQPTNAKYKGYPIILRNNDLFYLQQEKLVSLPDSIKNKFRENERLANQKNRTYFLPETSFNRIISIPPNSVCRTITKINKDLTCPAGQKIKYNFQGFPYCVPENINDDNTIPKTGIKINSNEHIITKDKILEPNRIGILPAFIQKIFDLIQINYKIYRYGVNQGVDSFLQSNSIILQKSVNEVEKEIINKLKMNVFLSLDNGDLAPQFNNKIKEFKNFLLDNTKVKTHTHYWDLVIQTFGTQIIIFDYQNKTILTRKRNDKLDYTKPFSFIIKYGNNNYEPIIFVNSQDYIEDLYLKPDTLFDKMYSFICNPREQLDFSQLRYQILDNTLKNKVKFLVFKPNFYLPISENMGPLPNVPVRSINKRKPTLQSILEYAEKPPFNQLIKITGQVLSIKGETKKDDMKVIGLMTDKNIVIPVRPSSIVPKLPISPYNYIPDADKKFSQKMKKDDRITYINKKENIEIIYHALKYEYSQYYQVQKINVHDFMEKFIQKDDSILDDENLIKNLKLRKSSCITKEKDSCHTECQLSSGVCKLKVLSTLYSYFQQRLEQEIKTNSDIYLGNIPIVYSESYDPDNQFIFTDVKKLITYLKEIQY